MKIAALAIAAAALAVPASAATFDFAALAARAKAEHGREVSFRRHQPDGWTVDGVTARATAANGAYAFLDGPFGRGVSAGLGVCEIDDCNAHWLDGIDADDALVLTFDRRVTLTGMTLRESSFAYNAGRGPDHTLFDGRFFVDDQSHVFSEGRPVEGMAITGTVFGFTASPIFGPAGSRTSQYLSSVSIAPAPVPLPASGLLLMAGLGALTVARQRRAVQSPVRLGQVGQSDGAFFSI